MRFNGKSNQQNYLNYDGVDGTYVWDASPGYLNATGSQFRLQTSMESVAEFRVNSGLAPAESGLGAGGNITVVSKSGSNRFTRLGVRIQARRCARRGQQVRRQSSSRWQLDQFGGSIGGPLAAQQDVLLRQLRGPAPDDRPELHRSGAERRGAPPHPGRRAGRHRAPARAPSARARWRRCSTASRAGTVADVEPAGRPGDASTARPSRRRTRSRSASTTASPTTHSFYVRYLFSDGRGRHAGPHRDAAPRARQADAAELRGQLPEHPRRQPGQRVQGRRTTRRRRAPTAFGAAPATTRSACRCPAPSPRRRSTRAATPASRAAAC